MGSRRPAATSQVGLQNGRIIPTTPDVTGNPISTGSAMAHHFTPIPVRSVS